MVSKRIMRCTALKLAFTLAEVLIVMGIIGIIAQVTIPTLIKEFKEIEMQVSLKKAYSNLSQALLSMSGDNSNDLSSYTSDFINTFPPEFIKYLAIAEDYGVSSGSPLSIPDGYYKSIYNNLPVPGTFFEKEVVLNDGMTVFFRNGIVANNDKNVMVAVDVNGYKKPPNKFGHDVFGFEFNGTSTFTNLNTCKVINGVIRVGMNNIRGLSCYINILQNIDYLDKPILKP